MIFHHLILNLLLQVTKPAPVSLNFQWISLKYIVASVAVGSKEYHSFCLHTWSLAHSFGHWDNHCKFVTGHHEEKKPRIEMIKNIAWRPTGRIFLKDPVYNRIHLHETVCCWEIDHQEAGDPKNAWWRALHKWDSQKNINWSHWNLEMVHCLGCSLFFNPVKCFPLALQFCSFSWKEKENSAKISAKLENIYW